MCTLLKKQVEKWNKELDFQSMVFVVESDLDRAEDKSNWKKLAVEYNKDDLQAFQEEQSRRMSR